MEKRLHLNLRRINFRGDMLSRLTYIGLMLLAGMAPLAGQDSADLQELDTQIETKQGELEKLREEIKLYQRRIAKKELAEQDVLQKLYDIDERISLTSRLVVALGIEIRQLDGGIALTEVLMRREQQEITDLQEKLGARFVHIYKQKRASMLELILTSRNWNQATYRTRYLKVAADYDRYLTTKVKEEIARLEQHQRKLAEDRARKQGLLAEKEREDVSLQGDRRERQKQINRIKRDRRSDERLLVQKRKAAVDLDRIITGLELDREARARELAEMRRERELDTAPDITFYRGKLPWPAVGQITARFGQQRNPILNTVTENTGIDIRARPGAAVSSVLDGLITTITYLRGYGTTLIIDHGKDLYTVYTHLEEVEAIEGQYVDQGQVIAHVGSDGSLDGAKLHFEIWTNRQKQDPEDWLVKPYSLRN